MAKDPIVDEIRKNRRELAKQFDYDLRAIVEDAQRRQRGPGKEVVSLAKRGKNGPV